MSTHYVVNVKVEKVTDSRPETATLTRSWDSSSRRVNVAGAEGKREVEQLLQFTAKHDDLSTVIDRVSRHLEIEAGIAPALIVDDSLALR